MTQLSSVILAAGQGTRMKSALPKVIHPLLGRPMLRYVIDTAKAAGSNPILVVVGFQGEKVMEVIGEGPTYVWQKEQLGTGHAVMMTKEIIQNLSGDLLVLYGDTPLLKAETIQELVNLKRSNQAAASILTTEMDDPKGYGRIIRNSSGHIVGIIEEKDANEAEREIKEVNTGVYCFEVSALLPALDELTPANAQGEYYLTDVIRIFVDKGLTVSGLITPDNAEVMGPNDRVQLARTEQYLKKSINEFWMLQGVTIEDPAFTYIDPDVEIGKDSVILPGTFLSGKTKIGENCIIGPHTRIIDSNISSGTEIQFSQIIKSNIGESNSIGPFAYIRPGTITENHVKMGDFVEIKNCYIGAESKVPHLSYLGDSQVGAGVNVGAGTITCNYDGVQKHRTIIKDGAFIGSNSNLVAPVTIGAGSVIAAGSTITKEVPDQALGIARSRQELKLNWRRLGTHTKK